MIRKLRLKFILINMTVATLLLAVIFGLVFHFTRSDLEQKSIAMMENIAAHPFQVGLPDEPGEDVRLPFFTIQVAPGGVIVAADGGYYDLSDEDFLRDLLDAVEESDRPLGVIEAYHLRFLRVETPYRQCLVFADISSELSTLRSLTQTCVILGLISFFAFLWGSVLLSKWAVRPLENAMAQQRDFVAAASHELKTPLAVITTSAELLQSPATAPDARQSSADNILTMARQMRSLVEQLLSLARAEQAPDPSALAPVDWSNAVTQAALPLEAVLFEAGLTLELDVEPGISVQGDPARLQELVSIFLDNARKYSRPGGTVTVTLRAYGRTRCRLAVANEGEPLTEAQRTEIFKRFYRGDPSRRRDGSYGLGLSIAQAIVTAHRGRLWAESENGVNRFLVELNRV